MKRKIFGLTLAVLALALAVALATPDRAKYYAAGTSAVKIRAATGTYAGAREIEFFAPDADVLVSFKQLSSAGATVRTYPDTTDSPADSTFRIFAGVPRALNVGGWRVSTVCVNRPVSTDLEVSW